MKRSLWISTALASAGLAALGQSQTTFIVSVNSAGTQGNQFSQDASVSDGGTLVAFSSISSNLVANDTNNSDDIFVHDRLTATTTRVSVATGGVESNGYSSKPAISGNGRVVAFLSGASNLVANDTNNTPDVFVHDLQTGITSRVSVGSGGVQSNGPSYAASISWDGRYVAYHSAASNLVSGDTNNAWDVFVHDRQTGTTIRASVSSSGAQTTSPSAAPSISGDGRFVAFHSNATNLVSGDTNGAWDIFVRDLQDGTTSRVSLDSAGVQGNGGCSDASISNDGRYVSFTSAASNLVPGDTNGLEDIFIRDRQNGLTTRASIGFSNLPANGASKFSTISSDGQYVTFQSLADNLDAGDVNVTWDVYVYEQLTGTTELISVTPTGFAGNNQSVNPAISSNGRYVAFEGYADDLVPGDSNNTADIFLRDRGAVAPTPYCTPSTTTSGCVPSISGIGTPSASASSGFTIAVANVEGQRSGMIFYGMNGAQALQWALGSTSFLCVKPPTQRTPAHNSGGMFNACDGTLGVDFLAFGAANPTAVGQPFTLGQVFYAQAWFRDPAAPKTTNLSDGLIFALEP